MAREEPLERVRQSSQWQSCGDPCGAELSKLGPVVDFGTSDGDVGRTQAHPRRADAQDRSLLVFGVVFDLLLFIRRRRTRSRRCRYCDRQAEHLPGFQRIAHFDLSQASLARSAAWDPRNLPAEG